MAYGTVKFFNVAKGFGFITADEGGKDVFVPAASITAAKISGLKTGQRVSFESEPDKKGPKAVNLQVIAAAEAPPAEKRAPDSPVPAKSRLTVYLDPSSDEACDVLAELRESGHDPLVVDYIAAPPAGVELRRLSMLLREGNQSLVRKYDPLFLALQLDDRFISDTDFWGAIHEHPTLINGPVVVTATQARLCHSADAVESFLTASASAPSAAKPKGLSDRLLQLVAGGTVPPRVVEKVVEKPVGKPVEKMSDVKVAAKPQGKATIPAKSKAAVAVKAKVATKARPPAKSSPKSVKKPAKKK